MTPAAAERQDFSASRNGKENGIGMRCPDTAAI